MSMRLFVLCGFVLLSWLSPVQARELAGVVIADQVRTHADGTPLSLNGSGLRRRFFVTLYVGALYLPEPAGTLDDILAMPGAKRFSMHFVHKEITPDKLVPVWNAGFEKNLTPDQFRALRPRIANFNGLFPTLRKGDRIDLDILPGRGVQVWINDKQRGKVVGDDFSRALLRIWLGDHPADAGLKRGLLGGNP